MTKWVYRMCPPGWQSYGIIFYLQVCGGMLRNHRTVFMTYKEAVTTCTRKNKKQTSKDTLLMRLFHTLPWVLFSGHRILGKPSTVADLISCLQVCG